MAGLIGTHWHSSVSISGCDVSKLTLGKLIKHRSSDFHCDATRAKNGLLLNNNVTIIECIPRSEAIGGDLLVSWLGVPVSRANDIVVYTV